MDRRGTSDIEGVPQMKSNRAPKANTSVAAAAVRSACYAGPAPLREVMFEQLDYLLAHPCGTCPSGCSECARLEQIQYWLLEPFRMAPAALRQRG
jgi:hypothetical protein